VPRAAVLERDRRTMLFVYEGDESAGRAKWRYVTTGLANDALVEILEDADTESVRPGEIVLTGGHYTLVHDAQVRVVDDAGAAGGRPN
jgi:membrane fusion protein, multidrug efflux system